MIYEFQDIPTPDKLDDILEKARTPGEKELEDRKDADDLVGEIYKIGVLKRKLIWLIVHIFHDFYLNDLLTLSCGLARKTKSNRAFYE